MANIAAGLVSARIELADPRRAPTVGALIPAAIIQNPIINPGAKVTYSKLIEYARGREVATNNRLAADLVVSPRSVRNYIAALRAAGLVEVRRHPGKPNSYRLTSADK